MNMQCACLCNLGSDYSTMDTLGEASDMAPAPIRVQGPRLGTGVGACRERGIMHGIIR